MSEVNTMTAGKSHAYFTPKDYLEIEKISPIKQGASHLCNEHKYLVEK
ncbi:hypothetical protein [Microcystis sp. MC19]|nr:hypothetical protein [Microcystis sp. MC19]